jgi:acetyl-CoA carboxylase biotin carboxyl carrier protein
MTAFENLQELIDLLDDAPGVTELTVSGKGGALITIKRRPIAAGFSSAETTAPAPIETSHPRLHADHIVDEHGENAPAEPQQAPLLSIEANRVGIFHSVRPEIEPGEIVAAGQIVGYIESMKLMNEIRADKGGRVDEQLVEDGIPVEYGQPLYSIAAV